MGFFKNSQIAKLFKVSNTTITNWIEAAEKGLVNLELTTVGTRRVVIDNLQNRELLQILKNKGKKHVGRSNRKYVKPDPAIYKIFDDTQLAEIFTGIQSRNTIPYKYSFFDQGAKLWDKNYNFKKNNHFNEYNTAMDAHNLIEENLDRIFLSFEKFKGVNSHINLVDIGSGNGEPAAQFIEKLLAKGIQVKYLPIDFSQELLDIATKNIVEKFPNVKVVPHLADLENSNISKILLENKSEGDINFVLMLGILGNYKGDPAFLRRIRNSLSENDHLILGCQILSENIPLQPSSVNNFHTERTEWIADCLGLKNYYYTDNIIKVKSHKLYEYRTIKINNDVTIALKIGNKEQIINLYENEDILVYEFSYLTEIKIIEMAMNEDFSIEYFTTNTKRNYSIALLSLTKKIL
ncbi:MAG: L-histidine N(alpha)-methyltransferase [bacterium]